MRDTISKQHSLICMLVCCLASPEDATYISQHEEQAGLQVRLLLLDGRRPTKRARDQPSTQQLVFCFRLRGGGWVTSMLQPCVLVQYSTLTCVSTTYVLCVAYSCTAVRVGARSALSGRDHPRQPPARFGKTSCTSPFGTLSWLRSGRARRRFLAAAWWPAHSGGA